MLDYFWSRLPLALLFAGGYLLYRLLDLSNLTRAFVDRTARLSKGRTGVLLLTITASAALLSFFISNTVTMLAFLPLLKSLDRDYRKLDPDADMTTPLTLSAIYGANIGGMGSLIGSPANLLLLGALDYFRVPGREQITFLNWFYWSLPLVVLLVLAAWGVILLFGVDPRARRLTALESALHRPAPLSPSQRTALRLFILFLGFWSLEAVLTDRLPLFAQVEQEASILFTLVFTWLAMAPRSGRPPLVPWRFFFQGVPVRGVLFLLLLGGVAIGVRALGLDRELSRILVPLVSDQTPMYLVFLFTCLAVIFATEVLSNTLVSAAFFPVAFHAAQAHAVEPMALMLAVSISSTCAFMTPIATPCNALGFGEMRGTSLPRMLGLGAVLNVIGAGLMTLWLTRVIPMVYPAMLG